MDTDSMCPKFIWVAWLIRAPAYNLFLDYIRLILYKLTPPFRSFLEIVLQTYSGFPQEWGKEKSRRKGKIRLWLLFIVSTYCDLHNFYVYFFCFFCLLPTSHSQTLLLFTTVWAGARDEICFLDLQIPNPQLWLFFLPCLHAPWLTQISPWHPSILKGSIWSFLWNMEFKSFNPVPSNHAFSPATWEKLIWSLP